MASIRAKHPATARIRPNQPESPGIEARSYRDHRDFWKLLRPSGLRRWGVSTCRLPVEDFWSFQARDMAEWRAIPSLRFHSLWSLADCKVWLDAYLRTNPPPKSLTRFPALRDYAKRVPGIPTLGPPTRHVSRAADRNPPVIPARLWRSILQTKQRHRAALHWQMARFLDGHDASPRRGVVLARTLRR
jgi:hypothetical protein